MGDIQITGGDPVLPSRFKIAECSSAALAACGAAAAALWHYRSGETQTITVPAEGAAATLVSFLFQRLLDREMTPERIDQPTSQIYPTKDGRWVHTHGGFRHLAEGILDILQCEETKEAIGAAILNWNAKDLEDEIARRGLCGAMLRTWDEWRAHPQGQALTSLPPVEVIKIGESKPEPLPPGDRPLSGIKCLDLTRVLAGPTCARTLAAHGAEVLKINSPDLPFIPAFVMDTGHGKRSAFMDLNKESDKEQLAALVKSADVFSNGYRAGSLEKKGFSPEALAGARPGIIYVSINCYGHEGPWVHRPGWEQLAQSVTGQAITEGGKEAPRLIPAAANDYTTGYLAALGVMTALLRRAEEGGSYHVRASLCQTAMWMTRQGLVDNPQDAPPTDLEALGQYMEMSETPFGQLAHLGPVVQMDKTPPRWVQPTVPLGTHSPAWED
ncbi:MAG: hypothetical protein EP340_03715 [Alphaproteobacteria bacterium]|nr:MAG: hypothetical protein EP340_03715 [Alphaproteobacteria bacterium]